MEALWAEKSKARLTAVLFNLGQMVQADGKQFSDSPLCLSSLLCPISLVLFLTLPVCFHPFPPAEEDDGPLSEQGTSASTKRTSLSRGISVTSNLEERHVPVVESKTYPEEEEDEESLEKIMFQSNHAF